MAEKKAGQPQREMVEDEHKLKSDIESLKSYLDSLHKILDEDMPDGAGEARVHLASELRELLREKETLAAELGAAKEEVKSLREQSKDMWSSLAREFRAFKADKNQIMTGLSTAWEDTRRIRGERRSMQLLLKSELDAFLREKDSLLADLGQARLKLVEAVEEGKQLKDRLSREMGSYRSEITDLVSAVARLEDEGAFEGEVQMPLDVDEAVSQIDSLMNEESVEPNVVDQEEETAQPS